MDTQTVAQPVTLEGLQPGVAVIVAAGADPARPAAGRYRLRITSVHPLFDGSGWGTMAAIGGHRETLAGEPVALRWPYNYREARVALEGLAYAEQVAGSLS